MDKKEIYYNLVSRKSDIVIAKLSAKEPDSLNCYEKSALAIAYYIKKKRNLIEKFVSMIDESECDPDSRSIYLEAQMLLKKEKGAKKDEIYDLAERAYNINPNAVFAMFFIAEKFRKKKI